MNDGHAVFLHLTNGTFHCLPDNYEVVDPSLDDIRNAFKPLYGQREIMALDQETTLGRDLFGRRYLPGFVGLNNLNKTDCINATLQALAHVKPLRNFFLSCGSGEPFEVVLNISSSKSKSARKRKLNDSGKKTKPKVTKQLV